MKLFELIQSKIELIKLERRYTRRHNRRSTFVSDAMYVDGEYVYNASAKPAQHTGGSSTSGASKTSTNSGSTGNRAESRMQRKRGNSLIMEVNAELERAEREHEMEVEDMLGRIVPLETSNAVDSATLPERKKKNRMNRISVRDFKWDTGKAQ